MSERGTFVTSYLYDFPNLVPALRKALPSVCRTWGFREIVVEEADTAEKTRAFMGVMHGGYPGEEALDMENLVLDELLAVLPESHGLFSITVLPESQECAVVFAIKDRKVQRYKVGDPEPIE